MGKIILKETHHLYMAEESKCMHCRAALLTTKFKGSKKIMRRSGSELFSAAHQMKVFQKVRGF